VGGESKEREWNRVCEGCGRGREIRIEEGVGGGEKLGGRVGGGGWKVSVGVS